MRCFVCSDIHESSQRLERLLAMAGAPLDAVLFAGDLTNLGSRAVAQSLLALCGELPVYTIPGNMDGAPVMEVFAEQTHCVHAAQAQCGDWRVIGFGGGAPHNSGDTLFSDEDLTAALTPLLAGSDPQRTILLTHQPPYGTTLDCLGDDKHVGSQAVRALIDEYQPRYHFCGHIHASWNEARLGATHAINIAAVTEGRAGVLDLSSDTFTRLTL